MMVAHPLVGEERSPDYRSGKCTWPIPGQECPWTWQLSFRLGMARSNNPMVNGQLAVRSRLFSLRVYKSKLGSDREVF